MRGTRNRWAVALRIARRSVLTSWGRSLLIIALIAAPITGLSAAAVLLPSTQSTLQERIDNTLGHAQAKLIVVGSPADKLQQGVEGGYDYVTDSGQEGNAQVDAVDPRTVLPRGTEVLAIGTASATFRTANGEVSLAATTGPSWDRSLDAGPYAFLSGRRPAATDEILLSPAALTRLGASVGSTVNLVAPTKRTLTVVGTSRDRSQPSSAQTVFATARLLPSSGTAESLTYYVPSTTIGWATVQRLNAAGTTAFSREVVLDPPSTAVSSGGGLDTSVVAVVAIALVFALLEVALLAGAAFLVGARLQQRTLAVIAGVGADRSVLRRIVTANGVVLGAIGGVIGAGLGVVAAIVVMRLTDDGSWTRYPGLHVEWPLLVAIAVFGVVVGWLAALVPARAASRFDVVRALRGARTPQRIGKRPVLGLVLLGVGIGSTLLGGVALYNVLQHGDMGGGGAGPIGAIVLLSGGPVLAQLGVLLCSGLVLRGVARLLARAPLPARLAARDTSRNLGRAVPAAASVMTTVFVAAFIMCIANAVSLQSATSHWWQAPRVGDGVSTIVTGSGKPPTAADARQQIDVLRRDLPVRSIAIISITSPGPEDMSSNRLRDAIATIRPSAATGCNPEQQRVASDMRCGPFSTAAGGATWLTVGDSKALGMLLGHAPSSAALATLQAGGAVALRTDLAPHGGTTLDWFTPKQWNDQETATPRRTTTLRSVVDLPAHPLQDALFVTTATAKHLGTTTTPDRAVFTFSREPTQAELDSAGTAIGALANQPGISGLTVETGPQDFGSLISWWILLACLIIAISAGATAIGLARVDGRADDLTLASLGAGARIRKSIAFVQALIICGVGAIIGTALGLLPAVALGLATTSLPFAPPLLQLVLTAIGIPVVIAVGSWLLVGTRRGNLTRRTAIA